MPRPNEPIRVAGAWLAIASATMIVVLALHGPIAPILHDQMTMIAERPTMWSVVHWMASAALSLYAVAGLIALTSGARVTADAWSMTAWATLTVGALWTLTTAVAEATVVANAAVAGEREVFETWWAFAEGKGNGFAFLALALVVLAANDARSSARATPAWSAWSAMVLGVASFSGWALGMWFGIGAGNLLWVASTILLSAWTVWFGVALMRSRGSDDPAADGSHTIPS